MKLKRGDKLPSGYQSAKDENGVFPPFKLNSYYLTEKGQVVKCTHYGGSLDNGSWAWDLPESDYRFEWWDERNGNAPEPYKEFWPLAGEVDKDGNPLPDEYVDEPEDPEVILESRKRTIQMLLQMTLEQCGGEIGARDLSRRMADVLVGPAGEMLLQEVQNVPQKTVTRKKATRKKVVKKKKAVKKAVK